MAPCQGSCHARSMHEPCTRHARELGFVLQLLTEEQIVPCFSSISLSKMVRFQSDGFSLRPREVQDMATSAYVVSDMNSKVFPCAVLQVWSSKPAGKPPGPAPGARGQGPGQRAGARGRGTKKKNQRKPRNTRKKQRTTNQNPRKHYDSATSRSGKGKPTNNRRNTSK